MNQARNLSPVVRGAAGLAVGRLQSKEGAAPSAPARLRRKICRTCKAEKPLRQFYKHPSYAGGRMNDCKDCKRAYSREMHYLKRDQILARQKRYYRGNWATERAKRRAYQQSPRGRAVHRESCRVYMRLKRMEARA